MAILADLFEQFVRERIYEKNITPKTDKAHRQAWTSFTTNCPDITTPEQLNKAAIILWLEALHKTTIRPTSINCYARSLNAFFKWLLDNEYITEKVKIAKLATSKEVVKTLPEENLKALLAFKPPTFVERRIHALVLTILDTGIRIEEALTLCLPDLDLRDERLKVYGKGRKERIVPFSPDLRRLLARYLDSPELRGLPPDRYVFCTRRGGRLLYDNTRRDYLALCDKLGIKRLGAFHRMRHTFATTFIKSGGNVMYLKDMLGHSELRTTQIYVHNDIETLREAQHRGSILSNLGRGRKREQ
jgi:integrase/recombinase XerD